MRDPKNTTKVASHNKRNASIVKFLGACIFVCLVFNAGFMARGNTVVLNALGLTSLETESQVNPGATVSGSTYDSLSARVAEVEGILSQDSMDSSDLNQATSKVLSAYAETTDDTFLRYYDDKSYQSYLASTKNPEAGIGILFGENDGTCFVSDVFEGSSAAAAGIQPGDCVESIDGDARSSWTTPDVLNALSRSDGQSVYVTWRRPSTVSGKADTTFATNLTFSSSTKDNVTYEVDGQVGVVSVTQIAADSASAVSDAINTASAQGAQAFVLDLRDVPGGYLTQAVDIASLFIQSGTVVQIQTQEGTTARSADGKSITSAPLVVLTNERTAGCAEVLAAALQDTDRATLVGTKTQGKGSVQIMQPLSFGGALRYTAAYYLTPKGGKINGNGVTPDVETSNADTQYTVALDVANSQIGS